MLLGQSSKSRSTSTWTESASGLYQGQRRAGTLGRIVMGVDGRHRQSASAPSVIQRVPDGGAIGDSRPRRHAFIRTWGSLRQVALNDRLRSSFAGSWFRSPRHLAHALQSAWYQGTDGLLKQSPRGYLSPPAAARGSNACPASWCDTSRSSSYETFSRRERQHSTPLNFFASASRDGRPLRSPTEAELHQSRAPHRHGAVKSWAVDHGRPGAMPAATCRRHSVSVSPCGPTPCQARAAECLNQRWLTVHHTNPW